MDGLNFCVLSLSNSPSIGGGNRSLLLLNQGLRSRGIGTHVVIPAEGPMADACALARIPYELRAIDQISWLRPDLAWSSYRGWQRILRRCQCDVVHANDVMPARAVLFAATQARIPVVCHVHFPLGRAGVVWVFRHLPKPAAFIFASQALQDEVGPDLRRACPNARQFVIHNGTDLHAFQPHPRRTQRKRVGILANLIPCKGHKDYLQMARLLADRGVDAEHWIIGEDVQGTGYAAELEHLVGELGMRETVKFLGHRRDVPDLLNELDLVVCASHVEPFGLCLIEAMACARPVVATRVGGIPEVVEDGVTGILVAPESPEQLTEATGRLLSDAELSRRMGKAGRERVEQRFRTEAHIDAVLAVYHSVLNQ